MILKPVDSQVDDSQVEASQAGEPQSEALVMTVFQMTPAKCQKPLEPVNSAGENEGAANDAGRGDGA